VALGGIAQAATKRAVSAAASANLRG